MQAALQLTPPTLPLTTPPQILATPLRSTLAVKHTSARPIKAATVGYESATVDYSSMTSVFPAEACETLGGEACDVQMYPEIKLNPESKSNEPKTAMESVDREYLEYDSPRTVFLEEACDDLGGEFCAPVY